MTRKRLPALKDYLYENLLFARRLFCLLSLVVLASLVIIIRLSYLQIIEHKRYTTLSQQNLLNIVPIEPNRGLIYDRHGVLLAENVPVFNLEITPGQVPDLNQTLTALTKLLQISDDEIERFQQIMRQHRRYESIPLRIKLPEEEVARFYVNQYRFPGVAIKARLIRHYPLGSTVAHVLGYVGRLNTEELKTVDDINYQATNHIGKIGIEHSFETRLHGKIGYQEVEIDASGRIIRTLKRHAPVAGDNLYLSIDSGLSAIVEKAMAPYRGAVVAIDPRTGEVLTIVSSPSYDPNPFVVGISNQAFNTLQNARNKPLYNRALHGQYPPGSTIKPFLALGSLALHMNTADRKIWDPGWYRLPDSTHIYHDWLSTGHGWIDLTHAIIDSCDTYFFDLAARLGITNIHTILDSFGFGQRTGIELSEERPGILPSPEWKLSARQHPWYPGDTLITGIGQGYMLATPLQLAAATAMLATHGRLMQPTVLLNPDKPQPIHILDLKPSTWQIVIDAMRQVIDDPQGTGRRFGRDAPYRTAAKTGTSQVISKRINNNLLPENLRDHSLFIAFAPIEQPTIALAVIIENDPIAPVISRQILDAYLLKEKEHATEQPDL
jgi:penicillin-binding protein 2